MVIREILNDPLAEVARFDFFNDYKDTRSWLVDNGPANMIALLDAANAVWLQRHNEVLMRRVADRWWDRTMEIASEDQELGWDGHK